MKLEINMYVVNLPELYLNVFFFFFYISAGPGGDMQWCFSQVKGAIDDDVAEGMSSAKN